MTNAYQLCKLHFVHMALALCNCVICEMCSISSYIELRLYRLVFNHSHVWEWFALNVTVFSPHSSFASILADLSLPSTSPLSVLRLIQSQRREGLPFPFVALHCPSKVLLLQAESGAASPGARERGASSYTLSLYSGGYKKQQRAHSPTRFPSRFRANVRNDFMQCFKEETPPRMGYQLGGTEAKPAEMGPPGLSQAAWW